MARKCISILMALCLLLTSCSSLKQTKPQMRSQLNGTGVAKNIIFMIVDGMGFEHVKAARIYNGNKPFSYEKFPCQTKVSTCSFDGANSDGHCLADSSNVTDSAAAATAMATGGKVKNGAISRALPQEKSDMETILEHAKRQGKSTGVIATKLFTDATPAAFVSHADDRDMTEEILKDMFHNAMPNLVFGADTEQHRQIARTSVVPYEMVHSAQDLKKMAERISKEKSCVGVACAHVYGGFGFHDMIAGYDAKGGLPLEINKSAVFKELGTPHLSEMTDAALKILSKNEQGFFLMVESSMPDMISHYNRQFDGSKKAKKAINVLVKEMMEVQNTIKVLESFVKANPDTLVVLTADHETGGLMIEQDKTACLGKKNCLPTVRWTSDLYKEDGLARHTAADVPLYALGKGAQQFCKAKINNIDIPKLALGQ